MNIFGFLNDIGNYEDRKIDKWESDDEEMFVSTVIVSDGALPFETAVRHPEYNNGVMVIVEAYDSRESAVRGHEKWKALIIADRRPDPLVECCSCGLSQILSLMTSEAGWDVHYRQERRKT